MVSATITNRYKPEALNQAWKLMEQAGSITFLTHQEPDADGIGACAALAHVLEKKGKKTGKLPRSFDSTHWRQSAFQ